MNYEAGFCVFAFIVFCCVLAYALYRRALAVEHSQQMDDVESLPPQHINFRCTLQPIVNIKNTSDELLSRDDVLELAESVRRDELDAISEAPIYAKARPMKICDHPKGWQPWEGGDCPVLDDTQVVVMFADGLICHDSAGNCGWTHHSANVTNYCHILAWRVAG